MSSEGTGALAFCFCIVHIYRIMKTLALAFSGGLDTSYCVPRLAERGWAVHTVYVNTGGADRRRAGRDRRQAQAVGAVQHHEVDARQAVFDRFVRYLIQGNVLRGEVYPARASPPSGPSRRISVIEVARAIGATAVAHGSTGAGNDQVRFDVALRVLAPELEIITPDPRRGRHSASRRSPTSRRAAAGARQGRRLLHQPRPLGHHLGRRLDPRHLGRPAGRAARPAGRTRRRRARSCSAGSEGVPVALDGARARRARTLVARLGELADAYGIGRDIHVGETALGIKGRIGFEAGAALLLIAAHRELEKLVLTKWQTFWKDQLGPFLRRPAARGPLLRPGAARHRGADHQLAGSGSPARPGCASRRAASRSSGPAARYSMMDRARRHLRRGEPALDRATRPGPSPGSPRFRRCWRRAGGSDSRETAARPS